MAGRVTFGDAIAHHEQQVSESFRIPTPVLVGPVVSEKQRLLITLLRSGHFDDMVLGRPTVRTIENLVDLL
jgi:hypothetical protein